MITKFFDADSKTPTLAITFESKEEIITMYHRMNVDSRTIMNSYEKRHERPANVSAGSWELWKSIASFCGANGIKVYTTEETPEAEGCW